jgi:L-fucose mutarotase/ribose pyranase (RbsD/FucU family)
MKKIIILGLAMTGLTLGSINALANSDDYPASNFSPKVLYVDKDLVQQSTASTSQSQAVISDPDHPAAYFQPKVLYIDEALAGAPAAVKKREVIFDPNYPAAYFEPKVIYP